MDAIRQTKPSEMDLLISDDLLQIAGISDTLLIIYLLKGKLPRAEGEQVMRGIR